jgi:hypothetical protein
VTVAAVTVAALTAEELAEIAEELAEIAEELAETEVA